MTDDFQGNPVLANLVEESRKAAGMTRSQLAIATGMSYNMVAKIELGRRLVPADDIPKFADALGIPRDRMYAASGVLPPDIQGRIRDATAEQIEAVRQIMQ